jgi:hypothetical protein
MHRMMSTCPWKHALGKPREGVHANRIFGLATFDVVGTLGAGAAIALAMRHRWAFRITVVPCIILMFLLGVLLHWWFCVPTALNVWLGLVV